MITDQLFFTGINVILAWSVYIVLLSGCLSFAQGAFMAIGCYAAGFLTTRLGLPLIPAAIVGAIIAALIAAVIGYPALRMRGIYLILVTIGITFCVRVLLENIEALGGVSGFGGMMGSDLTLVGIVVVLLGAGLYWLSVSPLQRILDAVREDERIAASLGINVTAVRLGAFAAGAAVAAIGGALYGHYMNFVRPDNFDIQVSIYVVLFVILGGVSNMFGPLLGASAMTLLPEYFRVLADWRPTVFGIAIVLLLLFRPQGLLAFRLVTERLGRRRVVPARTPAAAVGTGGPVLAIEGLTKMFGGVTALGDVSLDVREGETLGIIGPNGAGKTALINLITGFYRRLAGQIRFMGEEIGERPLHVIGRLGIARTFQNIRPFRRMTVLENVLVAYKPHATSPLKALFDWNSRRQALAEAMELLELMGLADKADRKADGLAYGEARRLEIARALAGRPQLLLLDEPAAGMNEHETAQLVEDIRTARPWVRAVVLIEHDMGLIRALSDRIVAMDAGRKIAMGTPAQVLAHPDVRRAYLGEEDEA